MELRKLQKKDAPLMLEWMHDDYAVHFLKGSFFRKTLDDCFKFIESAQDETESIHLAIVNEQDEYMGTVSLKHIQQNSAEFGIALRVSGMGKGYSFFGMKSILEYGYRTRGIEYVYWCVNPANQRAIRFYEKHGFQKCNVPEQAVGYTDEEKQNYIWYQTGRNSDLWIHLMN